MESLRARSTDAKDSIAKHRKQIDDVSNLLHNYIQAMTSIISSLNGNSMTRIDRNGIWWNISSIAGSSSGYEVVSQADGQKIMYLSADGVVVVAVDSGRVLTAYPAISFDATILEILRNIKD